MLQPSDLSAWFVLFTLEESEGESKPFIGWENHFPTSAQATWFTLQCLSQAQLHLCKSNLIQTHTYYLYFVTFAFSLYRILLHDLDKRKNKMLQERAEIPLIGCKIIKKYI